MNDGQKFTVFCPQCEIDIGSGDHEAALRIANEHEKKTIGQHKPELIGKQPPSRRG
jgi:hypothetical protein